MLEVKNISKEYRTGELVQKALNDVSLTLRDNEFVSILGPSGSGKTTLLNIIGGLDRYDSGDLVIGGVSTKRYKDRDWDTYRNHAIGFVFQSYNLIPHQSVLSNVELALTIGGLSRTQRRKRAKQALVDVGLGDQVHKRPNQLSGGQMQRVAIARALVNDPEILLADEPTGALDSETSLQVMDLLKEVAKDRLVVMVTHNPELAKEYSTRIVQLKDGKIISDSDPAEPTEEAAQPKKEAAKRKARMSFMTSLALSFHNLRTKKARTILTAFAGSIGIIGIALILSLSTGVNQYITDIQRETMTSYPIVISAQTLDLSGMMDLQDSMIAGRIRENDEEAAPGLHADYSDIERSETILNSVKENNLTEFKKYLDDPDSAIHQYLGENGISYAYNASFSVFTYNGDKLQSTDADVSEIGGSPTIPTPMDNMRRMSSLMTGTTSGAENFSELMAGKNGEAVSPILTDSYDLLYGNWPENYDEIILILSRENSLNAKTLYQLGLLSEGEYEDAVEAIENGEEAPARSWDYEELCDQTRFYLVPTGEQYLKEENGLFTKMEDLQRYETDLLDIALPLKITGVVRAKEDSANATVNTPFGYTGALTDYVIERTDESEVIKAQEEDPAVNVLNGMDFEAADDEKKIADAKEYLSGLGVSEKSSFYTMVLYTQSQKDKEESKDEASSEPEQSAETEQIPEGMEGMSGMEDMTGMEGMPGDMSAMPGNNAAMGGVGMMAADEVTLASALDRWLEEDPDEELLLTVYDQYIDGATYEKNLKAFGKVSYDAPASISIYTDSFEDKESVSVCIEDYNRGKEEENRITYTDYVALLTNSITSIVNVISYVLIAFVAVSLIVSCIMIGIITHISVLERTREIGILRALGASKRNISQVFNAETMIIGLCSGAIGVGCSALLTIPINSLIQGLLGNDDLAAVLPPVAAVILVIISVIITLIGGLLPAKSAANKDPVAALRTE